MTPQKVLCSLVINIITELEKTKQEIHIEYSQSNFTVYFMSKGGQIESTYVLHKMNTVSDNKDLAKEIILRIRGIRK